MIPLTETPALSAFLAAVPAMRAEILTRYAADSCIASVRILTRVAHAFDLHFVPVTVMAMVFNPFVNDVMEREGLDAYAGEVSALTRDSRGWSVGLGLPQAQPAPGKFAGHVCMMTPTGVFVDPSLDQASRPDRDIILEPFIATLNDVAAQPLRHAHRTARGCGLWYEHYMNDDRFRFTPDWRGDVDEIVGRCVALAQRGHSG